MTESNEPIDTAGESYGDYSVDDEDQPGAEDTLPHGGPTEAIADELDKGYSPPESYSAGQGYGNTPWEEAQGESLDQRVRQEIPEPDPYSEEAAAQDATAADHVDDGEVGAERAGRLADPGQGYGDAPTYADSESSLVGEDVGIDGEAASAEEAAVHVVPEDELVPEEELGPEDLNP